MLKAPKGQRSPERDIQTNTHTQSKLVSPTGGEDVLGPDTQGMERRWPSKAFCKVNSTLFHTPLSPPFILLCTAPFPTKSSDYYYFPPSVRFSFFFVHSSFHSIFS